MGKKKVYLETTMFNFFVEEIADDHHINTVKFFEEIAAGKYEAFTSMYVLREIERTEDEEKRKKMLDLSNKYDIAVLKETDEAAKLAEIYVEEGVIQRKFMTDCLHIAIATVHGIDMIVSMNHKHIVKDKTIIMTSYINVQKGYRAIKICSPTEVMEYGKKDQYG